MIELEKIHYWDRNDRVRNGRVRNGRVRNECELEMIENQIFYIHSSLFLYCFVYYSFICLLSFCRETKSRNKAKHNF